MIPHQEECVKETGVALDAIVNAFATFVFPDDEKLRCYLKCQQIRLHFYNAHNNTFNVREVVRQVLGADEELVNECVKKVKQKESEVLNSWLQLMIPHQEECVKETGVALDAIVNAFATFVFPDDEKLSCYLKCQQIRLHFYNAYNNTFNVREVVRQVLGADEELVNECVKKVCHCRHFRNESSYDRFRSISTPSDELGSIRNVQFKLATVDLFEASRPSRVPRISQLVRVHSEVFGNGRVRFSMVDFFEMRRHTMGLGLSQLNQANSEVFGIFVKMKLIILYSLCFFYVVFGSITPDKKRELINDWFKMMEPYQNACMKKTGTTVEDVRNAFETLTFPDDENLKCYFKCQQVHLGFFGDDNNFNLTEMLKKISGLDEELALGCIKATPINIDACTRVQTFIKCCVSTLFSNK
ncbi:hypothetical protein FQA39_LY16745 [Lamprigera yunnana]|nr:hypothetical protein FQA39_LY16745 [Lamprigera yunnana]